ncbi:hypothetical protein [Pseudomonas sp. PSKL.D1]|uniref:hypothetical protein n=1 Tax=Pseudomonas sp. PSKL.D1 TaxID=3029060 RepID=UPI0023810807|nr:hypothetical protein [Pseudomonas sp. PSKL.D1]WDY60406.1 hypothetical protein PVV54_12495 [Pseudomonas sp. PSKL.D1]
MKDEKVDVSTKPQGAVSMSDFFRHGSVEEKRAMYLLAARAAIDEQRDVIRSVKSGEFVTAKCK